MKRYTKEQLLFYLKELSNELKKTPTINDMNNKKKYPSASTYMSRFGSWNKALRGAMLKVNNRKKYDKKELIDNLKQLSKELGRIPKTSNLTKWSASSATYRKYFGSWKKALRAANLSKNSFTDLKNYVSK